MYTSLHQSFAWHCSTVTWLYWLVQHWRELQVVLRQVLAMSEMISWDMMALHRTTMLAVTLSNCLDGYEGSVQAPMWQSSQTTLWQNFESEATVISWNNTQSHSTEPSQRPPAVFLLISLLATFSIWHLPCHRTDSYPDVPSMTVAMMMCLSVSRGLPRRYRSAVALVWWQSHDTGQLSAHPPRWRWNRYRSSTSCDQRAMCPRRRRQVPDSVTQ